MKLLKLIFMLCLVWQTAMAEGPGRPGKKRNCGPERRWFRKHCRPFYGINSFFRRMPPGTFCLESASGNLFCYNRRFYKFYAGLYHPFTPAPGMFFPVLPAPYQIIGFRGTRYLLVYNSFFRKVRGGFECVYPPAGLPMPHLMLENSENSHCEEYDYGFRNQQRQEFSMEHYNSDESAFSGSE